MITSGENDEARLLRTRPVGVQAVGPTPPNVWLAAH
jgi:hypothetical protein